MTLLTHQPASEQPPVEGAAAAAAANVRLAAAPKPVLFPAMQPKEPSVLKANVRLLDELKSSPLLLR